MSLARNPKRLAGIAVFVTASVFMAAVYGTMMRVPFVFHLLFWVALGVCFVLTVLGEREEANSDELLRNVGKPGQDPRSP